MIKGEKSMNVVDVRFCGDFKKRTIAFCKDELNYHINESGCADEYHDEICAQIELLYRLGDECSARKYKNQYLKSLNEQIREEPDFETRATLRLLKDEFKLVVWENLVA